MLRVCAAREMFVRTGRPAEAVPIVDLLMFSPVFPRSVRFSVVNTDELVQALLADGDHPAFVGPEERPLVARLLGRLRGRLDFGSVMEVLAVGLGATAVSLETDLRDVHKAIAERFFHHTPSGELQVTELRALEPEFR